jgi:hypothetical protein
VASGGQTMNDPQRGRIPHIVHASLEGYAEDGNLSASAGSLTDRAGDSADMPIVEVDDRLPILGDLRMA